MGTRTGTSYTGNLTGTVGSLITALDAILVTGEGWAKEFTGTNKAVYRAPAGNRFRLRVVDDGSTSAGGAREAMCRGGEGATDVDTLVDEFPTTAFAANSVCNWRKSDTADSTNRAYVAVADDRFVIMFVRYGPVGGELYWFGDLEPFWPGDNYCTSINRRGVDNSAGAALAFASTSIGGGNYPATFRINMARRADGLVKFVNASLKTESNAGVFGNLQSTNSAYPNTSTLKLHFQPAYILGLEDINTAGTLPAGAFNRAAIPYLFEMMHGLSTSTLANGDTFTDSAYDASSTFVVQSTLGDFSNPSFPRVILQTAGTWDPGF